MPIIIFLLFLSRLDVLSDSLKEAIVLNSEIKTFPKNHILLKEGERSDTMYFILKGGVRIYYLQEDGKEFNTWFLFENELAMSVFSFLSDQPSFEFMETLEDSEMICIRKSRLNFLYEQFLGFNIIGRKLTELYYIKSEAKANDLRILSAKQKYMQLQIQEPHLLNRVSLAYISSYLGISQETLSRIRRSK